MFLLLAATCTLKITPSFVTTSGFEASIEDVFAGSTVSACFGSSFTGVVIGLVG